MMRVLSILVLLLALLAPSVALAERGCPDGHMCWKRPPAGYYSRGHRFRNTWSGGSWSGGYHYRNRPQVVVVPVERANARLAREPGLIDIPLGIVNFGLGVVFGRIVDTSCPDDDISCHRNEGREEGRYDAKSKVADKAETDAYRGAYDDVIRNSGTGVEFDPDTEGGNGGSARATRGGVLLEAEIGE